MAIREIQTHIGAHVVRKRRCLPRYGCYRGPAPAASSCLISCTQAGPDGGTLRSVGLHGSMKSGNGAWTAPSRVRAMNLAGERCVEWRGFTWAVLASHSGPHARTIWYVRPLPSRSLGAPHPWPRVQLHQVAGPEMRRRRQRRLASRSLSVASPSDKRGTPLSNWGGCWARWGLEGDQVLVAKLSCPG